MLFPSIMVVDDEPSILQSLSGILSDEGFEVTTASNGYEALKLIETESPDLVLLDIWMPGIDGIETLKEIKKENPFIQVVIITGHGTIETAVNATKLGAFDFIEKPLSIDKVIVTINNALNFRRLEEENKYLRKKTIEKNSINGNSAPIQELKKQIATVAPTDSWVLIKGENGTGKELVARTIHHLSHRSEQPLIDVNCAALPEELLERELFGHEKEAIADASHRKRGKFEMANNGTLFLDEIGDMNLETQAKLLRVLQEQKFQRLGGGRMLNINVRVIAATNKDLEQEIRSGSFREELYYRLNVLPINVPALRERPEDIPVLIDTFLNECALQHHSKRKEIAPDVIEMLQHYPWHGNVRELKNLIWRLVIMVEKDTLEAADIPEPYNPGGTDREMFHEPGLFAINHLKEAKEKFEIEFIQRKLLENDNDVEKTAGMIGVSADDIYQKIGGC